MGIKPSAELQPVYRQFGSKIESLRTTLGLTQLELGKRVGLNRSSIANLEAGRQRVLLDDVEKFAAAFATTPKFLLRGIWL
jgi:transcriptional regulator with XRE-family HTH domain